MDDQPVDLEAPAAAAAFELILDDDDGDGPTDIDRHATKIRHAAASGEQDKARHEALRLRHALADPAVVGNIVAQEIGPRPLAPDEAATWDRDAAGLVQALDTGLRAAAKTSDEADGEMIDLALERHEASLEKYPDFPAVLDAATVSPQNPEVIRAILSHPKSAELCYHLARDPAAVRALNAMPTSAALYGLGKAVAKLSGPIKATANPKSSSDPERMSFEQYSSWRKKGGGNR